MSSMEITTRIGCRNACTYCPQGLLLDAYTGRGGEFLMDLEVFQECVERIPTGVDIHFSGMCEPWLNPECTRMVQFTHESGHKVHVFTTAVGMSPADLDALSCIPFAEFVVHLPCGEGYESITVDDGYLSALGRLSDGEIGTCWLCHGTTVDASVQATIGRRVAHVPTHTRAGNARTKNSRTLARRRGRLRCPDLRHNVLLPNGDVLLCNMDYGMKHVIGNLREQDYESLFTGQEFLLVQRGLEDESLDTLCRSCALAHEVGLPRRVWHRLLSELLRDESSVSRLLWFRFISELRSVRTPGDAFALVPRLVRSIGRRLRRRIGV